jgi:hypothetical protein
MRAAKSLREVKVVLRRCVGDQDVGFRRDCVLPRILSGRVGKCIFGIREWRLWCTVDVEGSIVGGQVAFVRRMLEVFERLPIQRFVLLVRETQGGAAFGIEVGVVIPCYEILVRVR